jgi:hypothetical protein
MTTITPHDRGAPDARVLTRVRGEFHEMPGLSPTEDQLARLLGLSRDECRTVLTILTGEGFLHRTPDGRYRTAGSSASGIRH